MSQTRRGSPKAALRQQQAELKRSARGKHFVGEDTGSAQGRAAERAKVHQLQVAAREAALSAAQETHERELREQELREEAPKAHEPYLRRSLWHGVAGLVVDSAHLAATLATLPLRAARLPFRLAASLLPRWGHA